MNPIAILNAAIGPGAAEKAMLALRAAGFEIYRKGERPAAISAEQGGNWRGQCPLCREFVSLDPITHTCERDIGCLLRRLRSDELKDRSAGWQWGDPISDIPETRKNLDQSTWGNNHGKFYG